MKIGYSQNKNVKQIKQIIQTLSKEIPNANNKNYLDEFNKIVTNVDALELLNKRLSDLVTQKKIIKYNPYYNDDIGNSKFDVEYLSNKGEVITTTRFDIIIQSLYMNWEKEYDTTGKIYQYRLCYVPRTSLEFKTNITKIKTEQGKWNNSLFLGSIDEGNTKNYTEISGLLTCNVFTDTTRITGLLNFYNNSLYLYCDDWSWLGNADTIIHVVFNGNLRYKSYENYSIKPTA